MQKKKTVLNLLVCSGTHANGITELPAVTKSGTGTWDLGRGDSGTWGRGDVGTWGLGDSGTRGLGDSGTRGVGTRGRGDSGTWGRGDTFSKYRISEMGQHRQES